MIDKLRQLFGGERKHQVRYVTRISPIRTEPYINPAASLAKLKRQELVIGEETPFPRVRLGQVGTVSTGVIQDPYGCEVYSAHETHFQQPIPSRQAVTLYLPLDTNAGIPEFLQNWQPARTRNNQEE